MIKSNSFFQIEYIIILILIIINFYKIKEKFSLEKINDEIEDEADEETILSLRNKVSSLENKLKNLPIITANKKNKVNIMNYIDESLMTNYIGTRESITNLGEICDSLLDNQNLEIPGNVNVYGEFDIDVNPYISNQEKIKFAEQEKYIKFLKDRNSVFNQSKNTSLSNLSFYRFNNYYYKYQLDGPPMTIVKEVLSSTEISLGMKLIPGNLDENFTLIYYIPDSRNQFSGKLYIAIKRQRKWSSYAGPWCDHGKIIRFNTNKTGIFGENNLDRSKYIWTEAIKISVLDKNPFIINYKTGGITYYYGSIFQDVLFTNDETPLFLWIDPSWDWTCGAYGKDPAPRTINSSHWPAIRCRS